MIMKLSLKLKLVLSYVFIALFCILSILLIIHFMLNKEFQRYVAENQEKVNQELVNMITDSFAEDGTAPDIAVVRKIGEIALDKGMVLQVRTYDDSFYWCMHCEAFEQCSSMLAQMEQNTSSFTTNKDGYNVVSNYEIIKNGISYGSISLEYYGPFYYNNSDAKFLTIINKIFVVGIVISVAIAVIVGLIMANKLARPIQQIAKKTEEIEQGHYDTTIELRSSTKEVDHLIHSVNRLAFTLGRQKSIRKRLVNDYAHELRTPLAVLQTNLEAMIDGIWEADKERLNSCNEEILRLTRMLADIDQLAEAENETMILKKTWFSLQDLIQEVKNCFEVKLKEKQLAFSINGTHTLLLADRDKIEQVIMNLISNAIKYTEQHGSIRVSVDNEGKYVTVSIRDTGIGIEEKDLTHIFDYLYRVDKSRNSKVPGSGIGLSIVQAIVDAHGGYITVESKLSEGTTFVIHLPRDLSS